MARVPLDWSLDIAVALRLAWPVISERLNEVPAEERFAWAREQPKVKADLTEFFPSEERVQRKPKETSGRPEVAAAPNVVDLGAWRRQKQAAMFREDDPLTASGTES